MEEWLKSIGFRELSTVWVLKVNIRDIKPTYIFIDKYKITSKEDIIDFITQSKINIIKQYMEGQLMTDENKKLVKEFAEANGYTYKDNKYIQEFSMKLHGKDYNFTSEIEESKLQDMTINDAFLCIIDSKNSASTELAFKMKDDLLNINEFISKFDCPTCPQ